MRLLFLWPSVSAGAFAQTSPTSARRYTAQENSPTQRRASRDCSFERSASRAEGFWARRIFRRERSFRAPWRNTRRMPPFGALGTAVSWTICRWGRGEAVSGSAGDEPDYAPALLGMALVRPKASKIRRSTWANGAESRSGLVEAQNPSRAPRARRQRPKQRGRGGLQALMSIPRRSTRWRFGRPSTGSTISRTSPWDGSPADDRIRVYGEAYATGGAYLS